MKKITLFGCALLMALFAVTGCQQNKKSAPQGAAQDKVITDTTADSTVYGVCGEGTAMHSLELITDGGDTLNYVIMDEDSTRQTVLGGLLVGDRLAVIGSKHDGELYANSVINLTTLLGKWTSIDKNFEIEEGGVVQSHVKAESHPWTSWKILNGKLLLNTDTFDIDELGKDSLYLENDEGIFVFKRQL